MRCDVIEWVKEVKMRDREEVLKVIDEAVGVFYEGKELFDEAVEVISEVLKESGDRKIEELLVIAVNALEVLESVIYLVASSLVSYGGGGGEGKEDYVDGAVVSDSIVKDREESVEVKKEEKKDE